MSIRSIVRHPAVLGGRWCFADTSIAVAEVRMDYLSVKGRNPKRYRYFGLSSEEIAAALAFEFPVIRETSIQLLYAGLVIGWECGEDTPGTVVGSNPTDISCICGREWTVALTIFPKGRERARSEWVLTTAD
jgi:uncharacterized protein (DUF433 family)